MTRIGRDVFRAIHEGRWLFLEYRNKKGEVRRWWFGVERIDTEKRVLFGKGLHLGRHTVAENMPVSPERIVSSRIVDGTYLPVNAALVDDIALNPGAYRFLFSSVENLRVLDYLADCNMLDGVPSLDTDFHLVDRFDDETAAGHASYRLTDRQFRDIVGAFCEDGFRKEKHSRREMRQLCLNKLSLHTPNGLYVLAYRELFFDVAERTLRPSETISFNKEFAFSEKTGRCREREDIARFLDADDMALLDDFETNLARIEKLIEDRVPAKHSIDDLPYFVCLRRRFAVDLEKEYESVFRMYGEDSVTAPIRAFFGELHRPEAADPPVPIALLNNRVNLDQLLSIYNAMNYPVSYIQGPPGTGKTNTIINTIVTAFFNGRTVLFSSYNNHPIDSVFETLAGQMYRRRDGKAVSIPFPVLRLGSKEKVAAAITYIKSLLEKVKDVPVYNETLLRNKNEKIERTQKLVALLKKHQEKVDLEERKATLEAMIEKTQDMEFRLVLEGQQLSRIKQRLEEIGEITDGDALSLVSDDDDFMKYLYFTSAGFIKRLLLPEYEALREILALPPGDDQVAAFNAYIAVDENVEGLLTVFPVVCTTCISARRLGTGGVRFDMTIIDEASQCNTAVSLVPVIRGETLMLVGDPQQLNPVITLDAGINGALKKKYAVSDDYDYVANSIYKTFLANDAASAEILLHNHYRCAREIISFNNEKYYNGALNVCTRAAREKPLVFCDVKDSAVPVKNTSVAEAKQVVSYIKAHPKERIGVITPFRNQKELIEHEMVQEGLDTKKYPCGTVHAFQGDEKDCVLFSLALTDRTQQATYGWVCNNRELINVATSRAKDRLVLISDADSLARLHGQSEKKDGDDLWELSEYVKANGAYTVSPRQNDSRALGTKPYKTETEQAFLTTLNHALSNVVVGNKKYVVKEEVQISHLFEKNVTRSDFFYRGSIDFVIYRVGFRGRQEAALAIELNGREHYEDERVQRRDQEKKRICREHGFELISVQNSYARRYNFVKRILSDYFKEK